MSADNDLEIEENLDIEMEDAPAASKSSSKKSLPVMPIVVVLGVVAAGYYGWTLLATPQPSSALQAQQQAQQNVVRQDDPNAVSGFMNDQNSGQMGSDGFNNLPSPGAMAGIVMPDPVAPASANENLDDIFGAPDRLDEADLLSDDDEQSSVAYQVGQRQSAGPEIAAMPLEPVAADPLVVQEANEMPPPMENFANQEAAVFEQEDPLADFGFESESAPAVVAEASGRNEPVKNDSQQQVQDLEMRLAVLEQSLADIEDKLNDTARLDRLQGTLERLEQSLKTQPAATAPVVAPPSAPAEPKKAQTQTQAAKPAAPAVKPQKPAPKWVLRSAKPGMAWVSEPGTNELKRLSVGETLPGLGKIISIDKNDQGLWLVQGAEGQVLQR